MKTYKVNNVTYKIYDFDDSIYVFVSSKYLDECIEFINVNRIKKIIVNGNFYKEANLDFLKHCAELTHISLDSQFLIDASSVRFLPKLESLSVNETTVVDGKLSFDLNHCPTVKSLALHWSKKIKGLENLTNVEKLTLRSFSSQEKDLTLFKKMKKFKHLSIIRSNITSLNGVGELDKLEKIELAYLRSLNDLGDISQLSPTLTSVDIENCKKIKNF